jgi:quinol monooxygenase YgiN
VWHTKCYQSFNQDMGEHEVVVASTSMRAKPEKVDELIHTMTLIAARVRLVSGCITCRFSQSLEHPDTFWWVEEWDTQADLERYRASREAMALTGASFLLRESPAVHVDIVERRVMSSLS